MEDSQIVALYWDREEQAIAETDAKYGRYCFSIANNILPFREDAQESVNDTYLATWNALPPARPAVLRTFLGKLVRRISIDRWRHISAEKRGGGTVPVALEELAECIPSGADPAACVEMKELAQSINGYLNTLPAVECRVFLMRYFELVPLKQIEETYGITGGRLRSMLHRTRKKLRVYLEKEGYK